jgi:hypothetical protein
MDDARRRELIQRYKGGPAVLREALAGLSEAELDHVPGEGEWSARMVAHHCADSEMTSAIRLRRLLAEERPAIQGYDEKLFAQRLHYDRPVEASLEAVAAARRTSAEVLDRLAPEDWAREGTHSEATRPYTVERWLEIYAAHCHDHAEQIRHAVRSAREGTAAR